MYYAMFKYLWAKIRHCISDTNRNTESNSQCKLLGWCWSLTCLYICCIRLWNLTVNCGYLFVCLFELDLEDLGPILTDLEKQNQNHYKKQIVRPHYGISWYTQESYFSIVDTSQWLHLSLDWKNNWAHWTPESLLLKLEMTIYIQRHVWPPVFNKPIN